MLVDWKEYYMNRFGFDVPNAIIIGGEEKRLRAVLLNEATGELIAESQGYCFESDEQCKEWGVAVMKQRKELWGYDYAKKYPKGAELRIYG